MKGLPLFLILLSLPLAGCLPEVPLRDEDPMAIEARDHYERVMAMREPASPPGPSLTDRHLDWLYQGMVRYPAAWLSTVLFNIPVVVAGEAASAIMGPTVTWHLGQQYQDQLDDFVFYVYTRGVNIRTAWAWTPDYLGADHDLVERDRREGLPETMIVPESNYPITRDLVPPTWD